MKDISTGERSQIKQLLLDFRDGQGEQDIDVFTDALLARVELFREEPDPVTGIEPDTEEENDDDPA